MRTLSSHEEMRTAKISTLILKFAIPTTLGMLINALYNVIDRIFIGNHPDLGTLGLAGISVSFPIIMIFSSIALLFGVGGATVYSIALGEKRPEKAQRVLAISFMMSIVITLLLSFIIYTNLDTILVMLDVPANTIPYTKQYLEIVLLAMVFQSINMTGNNFIRADGSPKVAMLSLIIGAVTNIFLDYIFIYKFDMGMFGAGFATAIGLLLSTCWVLFYFTKGKSNLKLQFSKMKIKVDYLVEIFTTGLPTFIVYISGSIVQILLISTLTEHGGDLAVTTMGLVITLSNLLILPVLGISQGAIPIIAFNYGAKQYDRVKETLKIAIILGTIVSTSGFLATRLFAEEMVLLFSSDPDLLEMAAPFIKNWFITLPIFGLMLISSNFYQALKKVKAAILFSLIRQFILLLPLAIILANKFGITGISYANPISEIITTAMSVIYLRYTLKNMDQTFTNNIS